MAASIKLVASILSLVSVGIAEQPAWAQCDGSGWTDSTTCVSGTYCSSANPYYWQCVPGGATPAPGTTSTTSGWITSITKTSAASTPSASITGTKYMFIFGDSYTATNGFNGFNANGAHPSASNPIGNPSLPGSTFSGGYNWVGDVLTKYKTSTTLGYNFAVGGATVDNTIVKGSTSSDLVTQVQSWSSAVGSKPSWAPWAGDNAIAGGFFGINDIFNQFWDNATPPYASLAKRYMDEYQILYNAGVRNFFVITVPPLQYTPIVLNQSSAGRTRMQQFVEAFNAQLISAFNSFKASKSDITVAAVVDSQTPFMTAINSPSAYGARDASCTGNGCLWYDTIHPNPTIQDLLAQAVANALKGSFF
ncbi:carbohydrate-binding module family 1 [Xylariaceae sp. FL1651]|nr:carbohydrate-binding module family 1 [Xylariaceae sp. FL1651]